MDHGRNTRGIRVVHGRNTRGIRVVHGRNTRGPREEYAWNTRFKQTVINDVFNTRFKLLDFVKEAAKDRNII